VQVSTSILQLPEFFKPLPDPAFSCIPAPSVFYFHRCSTHINSTLGEWAEVTPGVWLDCLLSPQLLAVAMDWIRRRAVEKADGSGLTLSMPAVPNYCVFKGFSAILV